MKPDDEPQVMMRDSLLICACFWGAVLVLVFLSGCTTHKVDVSSSSMDSVVDRIAKLNPPVTCRKLELARVPEKVRLQIDGDKVDADAGGEQLLRGYVACRSLYKDAP
jgi:hypothetical protein